jgi:organic hydroperoxide reductase OsmC/OhrA
MTTLLAIAGISRVEIKALEIPALGELERGEDRLYSIPKMVLRPRITLAREEDRERVLRLVDKAEQVCLVSRSMTTEIRVEPTILVDADVSEMVALDVP